MPVYRSLAPLAFETYNDGRCALVVGALDHPTTLLCYPSEAEAETYWLGDLQKMAAAAQQTGLPLPPPADNTAFLIGIGTVRACIDCGCLVAGGPSRCTRCVREAESAAKWIVTKLFVDGKEVAVTYAPCPSGCETVPMVAAEKFAAGQMLERTKNDR